MACDLQTLSPIKDATRCILAASLAFFRFETFRDREIIWKSTINFYIETALHFPPIANVFQNYVSRYRTFMKLYCRRTTMSKETETIKKRPRNHIFRAIGDKFKRGKNDLGAIGKSRKSGTTSASKEVSLFHIVTRYQETYRMDEERSISNRAYYGTLCSSQTPLAFSHRHRVNPKTILFDTRSVKISPRLEFLKRHHRRVKRNNDRKGHERS